MIFQNEEGLDEIKDCGRKVVSKLILHMDDDEDEIRNIVFNYLANLPLQLEKIVKIEVEKAKAKHVHREHIDKLIEKFDAISS